MSGPRSPSRRPGRVLVSSYHQPDVAARKDEHTTTGRVLLLVLMLPMFGQSFQYVVDVAPLYALSKVWPLLTLPLAIMGASRLNMPFKSLLLLTYAWVYGVGPTVSVIELGNTTFGAIATTIKVWSLTSAFGLAAALVWLQPSERVLYRLFVGFGVFTFVMMLLLWILAPDSAYTQGVLDTKLFLWDEDRGRRIYAPMFFGMLFIFILNQSFWKEPKFWKILAIVVCFVLLQTIYKQRTSIAAGALTVVIGAVLSMKRGRTVMLALLGASGIWAVTLLSYLVREELGKSLGGSVSVRQMELFAAVRFLSGEPWRWIVGVGSITRGGDRTLAQLMNVEMFYLADLGWLGVVFEYGVVGAVLLMLLHAGAIYMTAQSARVTQGVLPRAMLDYVIYILLTSAVYSVVFAPGELMTCMAVAYYLTRLHREREAQRTADLDLILEQPAPTTARPMRRLMRA